MKTKTDNQEKTVKLFESLVTVLTENNLFAALERALTKQQKEELGEAWFNIDRNADEAVTTDELCTCGAKKSEHFGVFHHLGCDSNGCRRFTWAAFIDKDGNRL